VARQVVPTELPISGKKGRHCVADEHGTLAAKQRAGSGICIADQTVAPEYQRRHGIDPKQCGGRADSRSLVSQDFFNEVRHMALPR
jgi:hypothetical protein